MPKKKKKKVKAHRVAVCCIADNLIALLKEYSRKERKWIYKTVEEILE